MADNDDEEYDMTIETSGAVAKWQGLRYRCLACNDLWSGCPTCSDKRYLTEKEAIAVYGCIEPGLELPYCHICLNTSKDELFAYAAITQKMPNNHNRKFHTRFIYRCKQSHGHEYPGWVFFDVFTGMDIHLSTSEQPR